MPRKTLFKPIVRPNMLKNPLWCEVFLDKDNEGEGSEVDVDEEDNGFSSNDELLM
jgi:hypothetical protein